MKVAIYARFGNEPEKQEAFEKKPVTVKDRILLGEASNRFRYLYEKDGQKTASKSKKR